MKAQPKLKRALEMAAQSMHVSFGEFMHARGLNDFLIDGFAEEDDPRQIAAKAIASLCQNDESQNEMDFVVCIAVTAFLDQSYGPPQDDQGLQRIKDLRNILKTSPPLKAYADWAAGWYR
jgi:hypothetical protein